MALVAGNIPPLVRLLQAYIEKGSKVIVQEKKEVTRQQRVVNDNLVGIIFGKIFVFSSRMPRICYVAC